MDTSIPDRLYVRDVTISDGKKKEWRKMNDYSPEPSTSSVKHGGGSTTAWACYKTLNCSQAPQTTLKGLLRLRISLLWSVPSRCSLETSSEPLLTQRTLEEPLFCNSVCLVWILPQLSATLNKIPHQMNKGLRDRDEVCVGWSNIVSFLPLALLQIYIHCCLHHTSSRSMKRKRNPINPGDRMLKIIMRWWWGWWWWQGPS